MRGHLYKFRLYCKRLYNCAVLKEPRRRIQYGSIDEDSEKTVGIQVQSMNTKARLYNLTPMQLLERAYIGFEVVCTKSVLIGAYYKQASFEELIKYSTLVNQTSSTITVWLLGNFNLPKVDWKNLKPL